MKHDQHVKLLLASLGAGLSLTGCGGGSTETSQAQQVSQMQAASASISGKVTSLPRTPSASDLSGVAAFAAAEPGVSSATVVGDDVVVQYAHGGIEEWIIAPTMPSPPADIPSAFATSRTRFRLAPHEAVGSSQVVIVNALHGDQQYASVLPYFSSLSSTLKQAGMQVTELDDAAATPQALKQIGNAGLIVYLGHGGVGTNLQFHPGYAIMTGQPWSQPAWYDGDWLKNRIEKLNVPYQAAGEASPHMHQFTAVTGKFWSNTYASHPLPHTLFVNCACSGVSDQGFTQDLQQAGVAAQTGWTSEQAIAPFVATEMLISMATTGVNLGQAFDALPADNRSDLVNGVVSNLQIVPNPAGRSLSLANNTYSLVLHGPNSSATRSAHLDTPFYVDLGLINNQTKSFLPSPAMSLTWQYINAAGTVVGGGGASPAIFSDYGELPMTIKSNPTGAGVYTVRITLSYYAGFIPASGSVDVTVTAS